MRPIDKNNFSDGSDPTKPGIQLTVKVPGKAAQQTYALGQKGTHTYVVEIDGESFHVNLVNKVKAADLNDGEAFLLVGTAQSGLFPVTKITAHNMVATTVENVVPGQVNQLTSFKWEPTPIQESATPVVTLPAGVARTLPIPRAFEVEETAATTTYNTSIDPLHLDGSNLYAGTGIPGDSKYAVAKTNYLEIAMAAHMRGGSWSNSVVADGDYTIDYTNSTQDFNIAFSISATNTICDRLTVTNLYDVWFVTYMDGSGAKDDATALFWHLEYNEDMVRYELFPHYGGENGQRLNFPIVDSEGPICSTDGSGTVIQNSFRRWWYRDAIVNAAEATTSRIAGTYVTRMYARSKVSGDLVADLEITTTATQPV